MIFQAALDGFFDFVGDRPKFGSVGGVEFAHAAEDFGDFALFAEVVDSNFVQGFQGFHCGDRALGFGLEGLKLGLEVRYVHGHGGISGRGARIENRTSLV